MSLLASRLYPASTYAPTTNCSCPLPSSPSPPAPPTPPAPPHRGCLQIPQQCLFPYACNHYHHLSCLKFICFFSPLCTLNSIISSWFHSSKDRSSRRSRVTVSEGHSNTSHNALSSDMTLSLSHCTLNSARLSVGINWKLIIKIFSIYANSKHIIIHSGLANNFSCSKGSGLRAGYEGLPHVGKE